MATKSTTVVLAPPAPTELGPLDSIGAGVSRAFQAAGMGMEVTHRSLWCVNRKVIEGQVTIALTSGNNIEAQKQAYTGGYDKATEIVDEILGM